MGICKKTLDQIATETGTDKNSSTHGYSVTYDRYFSSFREDPITLLEIGVAGGSSVRMWREYFPAAKIIAIDINPSCLTHEREDITIRIGDQSNKEFLSSLSSEFGPFDVVIDDGSHICDHMITSFETLYPAVKVGGMYIIEDMHSEYLPNYGPSFTSYLKSRIDDINLGGKMVDNYIVGSRTNQYCDIAGMESLTIFERTIHSIHFYKSLALVLKDNLG